MAETSPSAYPSTNGGASLYPCEPAPRHVYIGCTTDLPKRIWEHRIGAVPGFTRKYSVRRLVYVETYHDVSDAILRERRMKEWRRDWKIRLIERENPVWDDLAVTLLGFDSLREQMGSHPGEGRDP